MDIKPIITRTSRISAPLLYVSQVQRSGGTLLTRLFDSHPQLLVIPHEMYWGERGNATWPSSFSLNSINDIEKKVFHVSTRIDEFNKQGLSKYSAAKGNETHPFIFDLKMERNIFRTLCEEPRLTRRAVFNNRFSAYFNAWSNNNNQKHYNYALRVVLFTPRMAMKRASINNFFADYPDGVLVSIIRNPLCWLASAQMHSKEYTDAKHALRLWRRSVEKVLSMWKTHQKQIAIITFESLIESTRDIMEYLASRLNLDWDDCLLMPTVNSNIALSNSSFNCEHGVSTHPKDRLKYLKADTERLASRHLGLYDLARKAEELQLKNL